MSESESETPRPTIQLWYAGERLSSNGKLLHYWLTPDGDLRAYKSMRGAIGRRYSLEVDERSTTAVFVDSLTLLDATPFIVTGSIHASANAGNGVSVSPMIWYLRKRTSADEPHSDTPRWVAESKAARTMRDMRSAAKRAEADAKKSIEDMTIAEARLWIARAAGAQRRARLAVILEQVW